MIQVHSHQLQIDNDKYLITKRLFTEMYSQLNYLVDYAKCRSYVRATMSCCVNETKVVTNFETKKIDIQL
jgi:hypothetical protein